MSRDDRRWALTELLRFADLLVRAGHRPSQQLEDLVVEWELAEEGPPPTVDDICR